MAILNVTYCKDCIAYQKQSDGYNWCAYGSRAQMGDYGYCEKGKSSVQKPEPTLGNFIKCMESNGVKYKFKGGQNDG